MSHYRVFILSVGLAGVIGSAGCGGDAQPPPQRGSQSATLAPPTTSPIIDTPLPAAQPTSTADSARRITPVELQQALAKAEAIVVDVRSGSAYAASHIKGARSIPLGEVSSRVGELPRDKMIVTYCS